MVTLYTFLAGTALWLLIRWVISGIYVVDQAERAVKTTFGRAARFGNATTVDDPTLKPIDPEARDRYRYPQLRVIPPGGPYFKFPWQQIHRVSIATQTVNIAFDPEDSAANHGGSSLDAVTKDQLNIGLRGQLRYRVSERNLYAYLFGVRTPVAHVLGYFVSILREKIANFSVPAKAQEDALSLQGAQGISVNDLRKNLSEINRHMDTDCASSEARYGMILEATLITEIAPPDEVESALAAINTAHNHVSSAISLAQAAADQKIVQSRKAVEIETLKAQGEVQMLMQLADQLKILKKNGTGVLQLYLRNVRLALLGQVKRVIIKSEEGGAAR